MDEVFGDENFIAHITFRVKSPLGVSDLARTTDFIMWYARSSDSMKFREARKRKDIAAHPEFNALLLSDGRVIRQSRLGEARDSNVRYFSAQTLTSSGATPSCMFPFTYQAKTFVNPRGKSWRTNQVGMNRLASAGRLQSLRNSLRYRYLYEDAPSEAISDVWTDTFAAPDKTYVVQTSTSVIQRCILMTTDPRATSSSTPPAAPAPPPTSPSSGAGAGSPSTPPALLLPLPRARIMGARYPYYMLSDSPEGQRKEAEITGRHSSLTTDHPPLTPTYGNLRQGFVYQRVPHITLRAIANNAEIDVIWEQYEKHLAPLRERLAQVISGQEPVI